ncbi:MAG: hypothetical protein KJP23_18715 [Deltaproteobacteria bacterium]|nr:hypothetical protein [Deltaproteobacteria bacterium]
MISLNIEDLKPGMILTQPVRNHQGVLLLEAGAKITKKNIRIFKSWGVSEIVIKGDPGKSEDRTKDPEIRVEESLEMQLKERFSDVLDDPVMVEIFNAARKQLMKENRE